jgi:hypothetical protein
MIHIQRSLSGGTKTAITYVHVYKMYVKTLRRRADCSGVLLLDVEAYDFSTVVYHLVDEFGNQVLMLIINRIIAYLLYNCSSQLHKLLFCNFSMIELLKAKIMSMRPARLEVWNVGSNPK